MKKLHLVTTGYAVGGHGKEYITNFCNQLRDKFHIILYIAWNEPLEDIPEGITVTYVPYNIDKIASERFKKFGKFANVARHVRKQLLTAEYCKDVLKLSKIESGDTVFVMDYTVISLISFFRKFKTKQCMSYLWIHSARFKSKNFFYHWYKRGLKIVFKNVVAPKLTGIVTNGDFIKERISEELSYDINKIHVIQYPSRIPYTKIDKIKSRQKLQLPDHEKIILFFGSLRTDKNIEEVVKSTALATTQPLLIIAGTPSSVSKEDLNKWLKKYKHQNYRLDISYINEEKMALYYSASDVLLLTYIEESASQSGPLSLAREFDLPAIVTDTGEIGYYVKQNNLGLVARPNIENDFSRKIDEFFTLKDYEKEFSKNLKVSKAKFSWEKAAEKYEEIF